MSFTVNNHYKVKFHHHERGTVCTIGTVQPSLVDAKPVFVPLFRAEAYLSPKDQPNRNTGRKVALSKALQMFNRQEQLGLRKEFWKAYFTMRNGKF